MPVCDTTFVASRVLVLACLCAVFLFASGAASSDELFDRESVGQALCCERVAAKWPYLKTWSEWCRGRPNAEELAGGAQKLGKAVLLDGLSPDRTTTSRSLTDATRRRLLLRPCTVKWALQPEWVDLFMRSEWCHGLPRTHMALVFSPYTVFAEEHPTAEDSLVDLLSLLCAHDWQLRLDEVAPRVRASLNEAASASAAQLLLCGGHCGRADSTFDSHTNDL